VALNLDSLVFHRFHLIKNSPFQVDIRNEVIWRIIENAEKNYDGKFTRLDIKFRGALCYINAYKEAV